MSDEKCEACINFYKENYFSILKDIEQLQRELCKYKSKLNELDKCYIDAFTKIESIQKNIAYYDIRNLYQELTEIKDIIKFYIPEARECDGSEGTE